MKEAIVFVAIYHIYKMQLLTKNSNVKEPIKTEAIGMRSPLG